MIQMTIAHVEIERWGVWSFNGGMYLLAKGVDFWGPVEQDDEKKVQIGESMELFEKILW